MSQDYSHLPYRQCVGIMLLNKKGEIWVGRRKEMPDAWQMPQGGIDQGETPRDTALRELEEEIGTAKARIIAETSGWLSYDLPADIVPTVWKGKYRGQTQKWFVLEFQGKDADIQPTNVDHPEFDAWRWARPEELPGLAVSFKRDIYEAVLTEFASVISGLRNAK
jgi:putative (di)nucleoside polyphosphate hydrolase